MEYKKSLIEEMHLSKTDTKKYWKLLDKFNPRHEKRENNISGVHWVKHFETLFHDSSSNEIPYTTDKGPLDYDITEEELMNSNINPETRKSTRVGHCLKRNDIIIPKILHWCIFIYI